MNMEHKCLIGGYQTWLEELDKRDYTIWFGTLQFHHLGLDRIELIRVMEAEMQRIYRLLLTRIVRNPRKADISELPKLIGFPDSPVLKRQPATYLDTRPNDGVHYHFLYAVPCSSRLHGKHLQHHISEHRALYLGQHRRIYKIDLRPFVVGHRLADYTFKHLKRNAYSSDDVLILPKATAEIDTPPGRPPPQRPRFAPHELRAGFRRLLHDCRPVLSRCRTIQVFKEREASHPFLVISLTFWSCGLSDTCRGQLDLLQRPASSADICSAEIWLRSVGKRVLETISPKQIAPGLEAMFSALVLRDRQFQRSPAFVRIADQLAPLCTGSYYVAYGCRSDLPYCAPDQQRSGPSNCQPIAKTTSRPSPR